LRRLSGSWRPVAAWAVLILIATTVPLTDVVMRAPVSWLDKLVHGALYLVLGWLVGRELCASGRRSVGAGMLAVAALALFSLLDEWHQRWLPGRVASVGDWSADIAGATIGLIVSMIMWNALRPPARREREVDREEL
jgi:VanZ family protein